MSNQNNINNNKTHNQLLIDLIRTPDLQHLKKAINVNKKETIDFIIKHNILIDILSLFHIYNKEQYTYTVGLDLNVSLSEDESQLTADEGVKIFPESNLLIIKALQ